MTKAQWRARLDVLQQQLWEEYPEKSPRWRLEMSHKIMNRQYGPEPRGSLKEKAALWFIKRKVNSKLEDKEVRVNSFVKKLVVSLVYGIGASGPVLQLALQDSVISGNEWGAIASAFIAAFWGAFKSNTTVVAPSRKGESITGPNGDYVTPPSQK